MSMYIYIYIHLEIVARYQRDDPSAVNACGTSKLEVPIRGPWGGTGDKFPRSWCHQTMAHYQETETLVVNNKFHHSSLSCYGVFLSIRSLIKEISAQKITVRITYLKQ